MCNYFLTTHSKCQLLLELATYSIYAVGSLLQLRPFGLYHVLLHATATNTPYVVGASSSPFCLLACCLALILFNIASYRL